MGSVLRDEAELVDHGECHDIFMSGFAKIERLPGNCVRLICYVEETEGSHTHRRVVCKAVWPMDLLPRAVRAVNEMLARSGTPIVAEHGRDGPLTEH